MSGWVSGSRTTTTLEISHTIPAVTSGLWCSWTLYVYPWDGNTYGTPTVLYPSIQVK